MLLGSLILLLPAALPAPAPQDDARQQFEEAWSAALAARDREEMDRALRRYKEAAITAFLDKAGARAASPVAELNRWVDEFVAAWERTFRSRFAANYDRYLQRLDPRLLQSRSELLTKVLPQVNAYHLQCVQKPDAADWNRLQRSALDLIRGLEPVGDKYFLAFAWNILANSYNTAYNEHGDDHKALEAYEKAMELRKQLDLTKDRFFVEVKRVAADVRARLGIPDPETGVVAAPKVAPEEIQPAEGAEWELIPLEAGYERKPGSVEHPCDLAVSARPSWPMLGIGAPGSSAEVPFVQPKVTLKRVGPTKFVLEAGAGPSQEFRLSPKPVVVPYTRRHDDGSTSEHALMLAGGSQQDPFQGITLNLEISDKGGNVFYRTAATREARTPAGRLVLYDLNLDGSFGWDELKQGGAHGLPEGLFPFRYDAVTLGKARHSTVFSRWIPDAKGKWYELSMDEHQRAGNLKLREAAPRLGTVKVEFGGVRGLHLASAVLVSTLRQTKGLRVDLMYRQGKPVQIPIGRYQFEQGLLAGRKGESALIFPPAGAPLYVEVEEGKSTTLALGAPFRLAADARVEGNQLTVVGRSVHVVGKAGERYYRLVGAPLFDVQVFVKGGASGVLKATTLEDTNREWGRLYYPADAVVPVRTGSTPEWRLRLRKHPWFGDLDSDWLKP